jgi:hypothetical protein
LRPNDDSDWLGTEGLAPSGFLGENGNPRTYGVSLGIGF